MKAEWNEISKELKLIYEQLGLIENFKFDERYLHEAFEYTESLWLKEFNKISQIKAVLVSESPLFGESKKYIYNKATSPSSFFYYQDIDALPSILTLPKKPSAIIKQKEIMLASFVKDGLIVLDIFPFAFNENSTSINYRNMNSKLYLNLLEHTVQCYLLPKLNMCLRKVNNQCCFIYRYKRLFSKTKNHFEKTLNTVSNNSNYILETINGSNMSLDRNKLKKILSKC